MPKLSYRDTQKVIGLFDREIMLIPRLSKVDRLKLRRRVLNVIQPALRSPIMTPQMFMGTVEEKLSRVISQFLDSYGFRIKLANNARDIFGKPQKTYTLSRTPDTANTD